MELVLLKVAPQLPQLHAAPQQSLQVLLTTGLVPLRMACAAVSVVQDLQVRKRGSNGALDWRYRDSLEKQGLQIREVGELAGAGNEGSLKAPRGATLTFIAIIIACIIGFEVEGPRSIASGPQPLPAHFHVPQVAGLQRLRPCHLGNDEGTDVLWKTVPRGGLTSCLPGRRKTVTAVNRCHQCQLAKVLENGCESGERRERSASIFPARMWHCVLAKHDRHCVTPHWPSVTLTVSECSTRTT